MSDATARMRPFFTCGAAVLAESNSRLISPLIRAFSAGALPLYMTMIMSVRALERSSSQPTVGSAPEAPQLTLPGLERICAITSATVFAANALLESSSMVLLAIWIT
ncbi:MAG: hypothetical protein Q7R45_17560, partial [Sulfuricaulis sp.]|nr:hypothetical protein [Sulfuricaulis sp.]